MRDLIRVDAPIDSFAVGTAMTTSSDAPSVDCAYKLQEYEGRPCRKRSEGKATWPGRKQVYRYHASGGHVDHDIVTAHDDPLPGEPLLQLVMKNGRRLAPSPGLAELRRHTAAQLGQLPESLRAIEVVPTYDVRISRALQNLAQTVDRSP
jgi:nicotinate phosphoribosyltransferase